MGIKGLTDRKDHRLPIIGTLRKGGPKIVRKRGDGSEYTTFGKDLDHYRLSTDDPVLAKRFREFYTDTPREIHVQLPFRTTDANFSCWKEAWKAGGLQHRCDGETASLWQKPDGHYSEDPIPCPGGCKEVGRLNVFIKEFARIALVTVLTSSKHDIMNITGMLRTIEAARGDLMGIPFILTRKEKAVSAIENGRRVTRNKWLIHIEPEPTWAERLIQAQAQASLPDAPQLLIGPAPPDEDYDDGADGPYLAEAVMPNEDFGETNEYVTCETHDAILELWPDFGPRDKDGRPFTLDSVCQVRFAKDFKEISEDEAMRVLEHLQEKANSAEMAA